MNHNCEIISGVSVLEDAEDKPKKTCGCWSVFRRLFRHLFRKKRGARNSPSVNDVKVNETKEIQEIQEAVQDEASIEENMEELKEIASEQEVKDDIVKDEEFQANEDAIEKPEDEKKQVNVKKEVAMVDVGLLDGVMHVCGEDPDSSTESWAQVCSKKR